MKSTSFPSLDLNTMSLLSPPPPTRTNNTNSLSSYEEEYDLKKRKLSSISSNYDNNSNNVKKILSFTNNDIRMNSLLDSTVLSLKNPEDSNDKSMIIAENTNEHDNGLCNDQSYDNNNHCNDEEVATVIYNDKEDNYKMESNDNGDYNCKHHDELVTIKNDNNMNKHPGTAGIHQLETSFALSNQRNELAVQIDDDEDEECDDDEGDDDHKEILEEFEENDSNEVTGSEDTNDSTTNNNNDAVQNVSEYDFIMDETSKLIGEAETCLDEMRMIQVKNAILMDVLVMVGA